MSRTVTRFAISGFVLLLFLAHSSGWVNLRLLEQIEHFTYDNRVQATLPGTLDPTVVIVDIDETSLAVEGQWPWSRDKLATMVNNLFETYRIRALGFDIAFPEADRSSGLQLLDRLQQGELSDLPGFAERAAALRSSMDNDRALAEAVRGKPVVWGYYFSQHLQSQQQDAVGAVCAPAMDSMAAKLYDLDWIRPEGYTGNLAVLQGTGAACGFFDNPTLDNDGVYRRVPLVQLYGGAVYESLALALARLASGQPGIEFEFEPPDVRTSLHLERLRAGPLLAPVDERIAVMVPYRGPEGSFPYVSAADVIAGKADAAVLKGKIVLVGTSAPGLRDLRVTPVAKAYSGVEVHANIISGLINGGIKQKAPYYSGIETTLLLAIGVLIAWAFAVLSPLAAGALGAGVLALITALAFGLWSWGNFVMPFGVPVAFTLMLYLAQLLYGYFIESRGKREISKLFGQYVPPELVEEMAAHPQDISMEGESREMTVLFSDVRNFTSISEKLDAKELAAMINAFLTKQTGVVQKHRGTIDKYIGDLIMAFWGAPLPDKDHALNGVLTGMEMQRAIRELDPEFEKRGWPKLHIGVGINSGKMNVGNMGSEFRMAYTVIGDSVNLGSRLEGLTKEYGVGILISEDTRNLLPSDWAFREVDLVRVKGRGEPVAIYEPMGPKEELDPALRQDLARHRGAMKLYRAQQWDQAEQEFFNLMQSGRPHPLYELFVSRIMEMRDTPPGKNWDGAYNFTHK
ncbi:CHASE2 domain-containing protein [Solimonas sp. SE-A11]|uniref:CHASE2 domain-containing protein n=1 Tax=Solimonas sp. SE-A11 TaxID=3054954 RepID=UPI00259C7CB8|nr:adenylate/guanylate cyclase domain-containing protein [Solimonas sp. SE-A11]MDM4770157.1 adenylate/guanylate cyclase domain-containing protein [Solimonas sp. SE-A11]